jgi:hypothetical protein
VFVILAGNSDVGARKLADRWHSHGALALTVEDFSRRGWRFHLPLPQKSSAVVSRRELALDEITGVLTRLPGISTQELGHIVPGDRGYVAAEMTAFLIAWLSELSCPVINRPTPGCLAGPHWRREQWIRLAARVGVPVADCYRRAAQDGAVKYPDSPGTEVIVAGDDCFGDVHSSLHSYARLIARAAGVELLAVHFTGPEAGSRFLRVNVWPDVTLPHVSDAILACLQRGRPC